MIHVRILQTDLPPPATSTVVSGLIAQTGGQSGATPMPALRNIVETVPVGGGVILKLLPLPEQTIWNVCGTGQQLTVYPVVGTQFQGRGPNVPVTIADGDPNTFTFDGVSTWYIR